MTSQKAGNIKLNNKVSVAIVDRAQDFYKLRGLSMSGTAARVQEKEKAERWLALRLISEAPAIEAARSEEELAVYRVPRGYWACLTTHRASGRHIW